MIHFLFPPDEMFADQRAALAAAGFGFSPCPDAVIAGAKPLRGVPAGARVVYRGWMLKEWEYASLVSAVEACGATAFTSTREYLLTHHLPNWYPLIDELTPETRVYPANADLIAELHRLGRGEFFIKDYVKSLKTGRGPIIRDPAELPALLAEMEEYRGEIEGGVCVRRVEDFVLESETRYFVLRGRCFAPDAEPIPDVVQECALRIASPFFSVDIAQRCDGVLRVVEVGDGQVSDLVGWSAAAFAEMWLSAAGQLAE